jgi:non-specific protein-tyrosine kinase
MSVYFHTLWKRKWVILVTLVVVLAVVAWGNSRTPATYEAVTHLKLVPYGVGNPDYGSYVYFDRLANSYATILNSDTVTEMAMGQLDLEELPDFNIAVIPETELMRLSVVDTSPERAQDVANTLSRLLIEQNQTNYNAESGVQENLGGYLDQLETQIDELTAEYAELLNQIPANAGRLAEIQRRLDGLQGNYNQLMNSSNQVTIAEITRANALSVVETARLPVEPVGPNLVRDLLLGGVIGLTAGIALAFILESLSPRLYTDKQIEVATQSPIIAYIPHIKKAYQSDVFMGDRSAADAFRRLRTYLFAELNLDMLRFVLVTSAVPGEGKSTVAANLAHSLARSGRNVLLVDGDILRPMLHQLYPISNLAGLTTVLNGKSTLADSVQQLDNSPLHVLCAGPATEGSADLLSSHKFYQLLDEAIQMYDIVIFDGPAVLAAVDSLAIAKQMSAVLWVVDPRKVDKRTLVFAREQFEQLGTKMVGVIASRVKNKNAAYWNRHYKIAGTLEKTSVQPPREPSPFTEPQS